MQNLKDLQGHTGREQGGFHTYRDIPMFCDIGLHEACFDQIKDSAKHAKILVLGSGSGAFDQRLVDNGFQHVTSIDFRPDFFKARGTNFIERDLNQDFDNLGQFEIVIAIELIEHLENPAHFLRNTSSCLVANGKLVITTPNIESGPSRASFLIQRSLSFFTETDMYGSGHITLLPRHILTFHFKNAGFSLVKHTHNRNAWQARLSSNIREIYKLRKPLHAIRVLCKTILLLLLSPLTLMRSDNGNIHIYVLRKN